MITCAVVLLLSCEASCKRSKEEMLTKGSPCFASCFASKSSSHSQTIRTTTSNSYSIQNFHSSHLSISKTKSINSNSPCSFHVIPINLELLAPTTYRRSLINVIVFLPSVCTFLILTTSAKLESRQQNRQHGSHIRKRQPAPWPRCQSRCHLSRLHLRRFLSRCLATGFEID